MSEENKETQSTPFTKEDLEAIEKDLQTAKSSLEEKSKSKQPEIDAVKMKEELKQQILDDLKKQEQAKQEEEAKKAADAEREAALKRVQELEEKLKGFSESKAVASPNNPFSNENTEIRADPAKIEAREQELMQAMFAHRPKN